MIKLYDYFRSSASFRVRIALHHKNIQFEKIAIDLRTDTQNTPEYLQINPEGLVPMLVDENNNIMQSLAIIEYLEDKYPNNQLLPNDIIAKSYVRSIALNICCEIHPLNNLRVRNYLSKHINLDKKQTDEWYMHWININFTGLEKQILNSKYYNGNLCYGNQLTIADICIIPQIYNLHRFLHDNGLKEPDISKQINNSYPTLANIWNNCINLDAVKKAWPIE